MMQRFEEREVDENCESVIPRGSRILEILIYCFVFAFTLHPSYN